MVVFSKASQKPWGSLRNVSCVSLILRWLRYRLILSTNFLSGVIFWMEVVGFVDLFILWVVARIRILCDIYVIVVGANVAATTPEFVTIYEPTS